MKETMFTATEKKSLTKLLDKTVNKEYVFNLEELHGFLFGLAVIPELIKPSEWLPLVFGEEMFDFESEAEAEELMNNLFQVCNRLINENNEGDLSCPFYLGAIETGDLERMEDWVYGLYLAMGLRPEVFGVDDSWEHETNITEDMQELSSAWGVIMGVANPELIPEIFNKPDFDPVAKEKDMQLHATLFSLIPKAVSTVQEYARLKAGESMGGVRLSEIKQEKIGRNDPCPCGSGKKYKKCCGMN
ncbi:MAG: UPF0149 family protein [Nitrospirales bacterium]|nr:UPF0149 family protein [Nitrospirales bacterium]